MTEELLNLPIGNNSVKEYLLAFGFFLSAVVSIKLFSIFILNRLKKWATTTESTLDDFLLACFSISIIPLLFVGAFYFSMRHLNVHQEHQSFFKIMYATLFTFYIVRGVNAIIRYVLNKNLERTGLDNIEARKIQLKGLTSFLHFLVWTLAVVLLLDNLGVDMKAVVAGLGVGGIAVAIAAQTILSDLFAYFVIFFDRPFGIGDYVTIDNDGGTIEHIGIKSTRIRTLTGDQLVISNKDLTSSRMHNYKKMERRRVLLKIGVIYQTNAETLEQIPSIIKKEVISADYDVDVDFDRAHFASLSASGLDFEVVYYVNSADFNRHMDILQDINLRLFKVFREKGISFAYPTQTLYMHKEVS